MALGELLHYHVIPPLFLLFFTPVVQVLTQLGDPRPLGWSALFGSQFAWAFTAVTLVWAWLFLVLPGPVHHGPTTHFGQTPPYRANGMLYYVCTLLLFVLLETWLMPGVSVTIYSNMSAILAALNVTALVLCTFLLIRGKVAPQSSEEIEPKPLPHEFYRGMELHPHLLGVDVKQLTNCRVGMMLWQLLVLVFCVAGARLHGLSSGHVVCAALQTVYIAKFFWWETGYFSTLDITLDRAGYYLCWGCMVWVPCFYTYAAFFLTRQRPLLSDGQSAFVLAAGLLAIALNYRCDLEKQRFRESGGRCRLWGRPAEYIDAEYVTAQGRRTTKLLTSGCWGVARHLNYVFEILAAFCWCLPGLGHGVWPFLYVLFLTVLLVHRVFRDEEKCSNKYGKAWKKYCRQVPYRMIPYVF
ncbi:7-dehydrocholesterol reductase [Amphibalanus amphitrite]|uniref:7-dehydrocholesterol reductase n=1 Tax=Amphibalanus amphitrite TaxID=1232801 RepID=A0A6A4VGG7_AMPAM|nr:7-dehydrocholesterol reductase-like [Amphibalanus amphitrite]KAF0290390.1 7-dehydrocholesterol reductase [Amphibalanus amphitrite]